MFNFKKIFLKSRVPTDYILVRATDDSDHANSAKYAVIQLDQQLRDEIKNIKPTAKILCETLPGRFSKVTFFADKVLFLYDWDTDYRGFDYLTSNQEYCYIIFKNNRTLEDLTETLPVKTNICGVNEHGFHFISIRKNSADQVYTNTILYKFFEKP